MTPPLTPLARSLPAAVPFTGPEALERRAGRPFRARLGANESAFGPSPAAIEAMRAAAADAWMYPDPEGHALREALAEANGVTPAHIHIGEGIDGILGNLVRLTVAPGTPVVTSAGAYPTFAYHVTGFGGALTAVPYLDDMEDPAGLLAAAEATGAALIYLANPDNPMGGVHPPAAIETMARRLPEGRLLALDEAYVDFAEARPVLDPDDPRVIRLRTFSKAHGLAGARVGYAIAAPELVAAFDRVRNHFGASRVGHAGALAALADRAWLAEVVAKTAAARARIAAIGAAQGLAALPSATNFVALDTGAGDRARALLAALAAEGVFVRMPGVAPLDRCIRVTAGPPEALDILAEALPAALASL